MRRSDRLIGPETHLERWIDVADQRLEVLDLPAQRPDRPPLLFLHEGLGSVGHWQQFPRRVAAATGCRCVVYSRSGFGRSSRRLQPYTPRFMHEEALEVLPPLRAALHLDRPVLIGHSTGASMALIHAGAAREPVAGVVAMAPIAFIEESNLRSIQSTLEQYRSGGLRERLARHHEDVDAVFLGWAGTWLDPQFRSWSLEPELAGIRCPVLAILGEQDQYVTPAQVERIVQRAVNCPRIDVLKLPHCGHAPHRDQPDAVIEAIGSFVERCCAGGAGDRPIDPAPPRL